MFLKQYICKILIMIIDLIIMSSLIFFTNLFLHNLAKIVMKLIIYEAIGAVATLLPNSLISSFVFYAHKKLLMCFFLINTEQINIADLHMYMS